MEDKELLEKTIRLLIEESGLHEYLTVNKMPAMDLSYKALASNIALFWGCLNRERVMYIISHSMLASVCRRNRLIIDGYDCSLADLICNYVQCSELNL